MPLLRAEAGSRPAREVLFFASPKKSTQKKGDPAVCVPAAARRGNLRCSRAVCAAELAARWRAPLKQPQRVSSRSACVLRHTRHPARCAPRRIQRGVGNQTSPRAFASLGPISRAQAPRAAQTGPSAAMARMDVRLRVPFRMRRGAQRPADQGSRLFERSEFERDPAGREHRRLPAAKRRDAAYRVAFSLVTFSWRGKRKLLRRRAHTPAPALSKGILKAIKIIANSACCISAKGQNHSEIRSSNIASP